MKQAGRAALLVALSITWSSYAYAEAPAATATCERAAGPGRVRCELELAAPGAVVRWADVQIVETPPFVSALKGRIGPSDTTAKDKEKWRFSFGLVARARGTGDLKLRVRAVVCAAGEAGACEAVLIPVVASVASGS